MVAWLALAWLSPVAAISMQAPQQRVEKLRGFAWYDNIINIYVSMLVL